MADYRIKLSDGVDTIDLYGGSDTIIRDAGFGLLPPNAVTSFIGNPTFDGNRLGRSRYGNRNINMTAKIVGTSVSDLKDNIRTVQRLLNDAQKRSLLGYGSQVFLEYQWGDTINDSVFYDVIRGDLSLPRGFQAVTMAVGFTVLDATLNLICKPFGRYIEQDITTETLENSQSAFEMQISFLVDDDGQHEMNHANDWECQTFTTDGAFTAVAAAIKCYRSIGDTIGDITFAIYEADVAHLPEGSALATGTVSGNTINDDADILYVGWLFCEFTAGVALSATTEYALVVHGATLTATESLFWRVDSTKGYGADGQRAFSINGGTGWTADDTDDFLFAIYSATTDANYQDITTTAAYGDVPAGLYYRLVHSATGDGKIWIAKRSGLRQKDVLWIEGEDYSSTTDLVGATHVRMIHPIALDDISGGMLMEVSLYNVAAGQDPNTAISRLNYVINDIPRGQFRVLVRCKASLVAIQSWGFGWSYGDKTYTPTEANGEYYENATNATWGILDLGVLNIPPIAESDIAINNSFELRIFQYVTAGTDAGTHYDWFLDYIFLLPLDEGVVIIDDVGTGDVIASDAITDPPNVFILGSTNDIEDFPDYVGNPFSLGRESTRIYVLRDDTKMITFSSDVKYQPRFMVA